MTYRTPFHRPGAIALALLALAFAPAFGQDDPPEDPSLAAPAEAAPAETPPAALPDISLDTADVDRIQVFADRYETYLDGEGARIVVAEGNARVIITRRPHPDQPEETATVLADNITANATTRVISAQGNVVVSSEGRTATGDALEYRWEAGSARVEGASFREYGISFRAGAMDFRPGRFAVNDAAFSTCDLDHPDYAVRADRILFVPGKRIEVRGARIEVFQRRILRLPRLVYRIQSGRARARQALPVSRPRYSGVSGLSVIQPIPVGENLDAEIEPTMRAGVRGRLLYAREGRAVSPFAEISWKQESPVRDHRPVLVSRLPEVGLTLGPNRNGRVSAGYFREHGTGAEEARLGLSYDYPVMSRRGRPGLDLRVGGRASAYANGNQYGAVYAEAALGRGGDDTFDEIGLRQNAIGGKSPFLWDRVQVRSEAFGGKRFAVGRYRLEGYVRYDLERNSFYDVQVAVARRFSCLEPELRFSTRRQSVLFNLKVLGIGSTDAPVP